MTPIRHPPEELLLSYAAGTAPEPVALLVATHLAMCGVCRDTVSVLDELGGVMLESMDPAELRRNSLDRVMARVASAIDAEPDRPAGEAAGTGGAPTGLPAPLARLFPQGLEAARWKRAGPRIEATRILRHCEGFVTRLVRLRPGTRIPRHGHTGMELTLVLSGGFAYDDATYREGDFGDADENVSHRLVVDTDEPCLCLVTETGPIALPGPLGWLANPLIRFIHPRF